MLVPINGKWYDTDDLKEMEQEHKELLELNAEMRKEGKNQTPGGTMEAHAQFSRYAFILHPELKEIKKAARHGDKKPLRDFLKKHPEYLCTSRTL